MRALPSNTNVLYKLSTILVCKNVKYTAKTELDKFFKMLNNPCLPRALCNLVKKFNNLFKNSTTCLKIQNFV